MCVCVCGGGGGGRGEGAQQLQCKSEWAQCSEKQQSPCEKINTGKTIKSTPKKKLGTGSLVFHTFSFTPDPIT